MFTLSGFADEISADLDVQLDVLGQLGIGYLELRGVWDTGILDLSDGQVAQVKASLAERNIKVSAIGSPIGKIKIDDPFEPHLEAFGRALDLAETFGSDYIRLFSFFVPEGEADAYRTQVMERLQALLDRAKGRPVTLLHENESNIYGDIPRRCRDILDTMASDQFMFTFDPSNFVMNDVHPFDDAYDLLRDSIAYLHIKDGVMSDKRVVPAGQGDGQIRQLLQAMAATSYDGFASLEPHLAATGTFRGFSGPENFEIAAGALRGLFDELGLQERHP